MAQSLGRLVLDMAADAAGFERDMQRISTSTQREMRKVSRQLRFAERDLDAARARVTRLAGAFTALAGISVAGAARGLQQLTAQANSLDKFSRIVGLSTTQLQELRFAAEQSADIAGGQFDVAMQRFARRVGEAAAGTGELLPIVEDLGIQLRDQNGQLRSQADLFEEFAGAVRNAESEQQALRIAFKLFDAEGAKLVNLLRLSQGELEGLREQFRASGATLSDDLIESLVAAQDALNVISKRFQAIGVSLANEFIGPLSDYLRFLTETKEGQELLNRALEDFGRAIKTVGAIIGVGFTAALAKAVAGMIAAEIRVGRLTAQKLALAGASRSAAAGVALFGRAVSIATGPIGIIIGVLGTLALTYRSVQDEVEQVADQVDEFRQRIDQARESTAEFRREQAEGDLLKIGAEISEINEELERLQAVQIGLERSQVGDPLGPDLQARINELTQRQKELRQSAKVLVDQLESLSVAGEGTSRAADGAATSVERMARETFEAEKKLASLRREMAGPAERAFVGYLENVQELFLLFQSGDASFRQFTAGVELSSQILTRELEEMRDEFAELAYSTLPDFIQQMLGVADVTGQAAGSIGQGGLSQIGSNFAQAVLNGQGIQSALSSSLTAFGGQGIADSLRDPEVTQAISDAFADAFSSLEFDSETLENLSDGFALALGQAVGGNAGQAAFTAAGTLIGEKIGAKFGEAFGEFGGAIGAIIGSIIGDLVFGESVPKFQVRGRNASQATDAGTDRVINTAFGAELEIAFRDIEDEAKRQIVRGYSEFLSALSGVVRDPAQQSAIAGVISRFGVSSRSGPDDIEGQLEMLFSEILQTFDEETRVFVQMAGETLEARVQALNDARVIENLRTLGRDLGFTVEDTLGKSLFVVREFQIAGESFVDTFERLVTVSESLDRALQLTGNQIEGTRIDLIRFGADLVELFGDDAGALASRLDRALGAIFSDEELAQQDISSSRQRLTDLLSEIGVTVTEDLFTAEGFRELFDSLFGNLSREDTARLIEAGNELADIIAAEEELARIRGESIEDLTDDWRRAIESIQDALNNQLTSGPSSLLPIERLNAAESQLRQAVAAAQGGDLDAANEIPRLFQQAINLGAGFFGTSSDQFAAFEGDLRSLLEGVELGPENLSVRDLNQQQVDRLISIEQISVDQLAALRDLNSKSSSGGSMVESTNALATVLKKIDAKLDTANEDRRTGIELTAEQQAALIEILNRRAASNPPVKNRITR